MYNPYDGDFEITSIREAQMLTTSAFPEFIRKAMYEWVNKGWRGFQTTYQNLFQLEANFNDPIVTFYERAGMATIPIQDEGMPAGGMGIATQKLLTFEPVKRRGIIAITEEMVKFDKTREIMDLGNDFGVAQKRTQEKMAWDLMTAPYGQTTPELNVTSVYQTASSSTKPWINSASGATSLFSGQQLYNTVIAMQRQTDAQGNLLGVTPDSMIIPVEAQAAVDQVLDSQWLGFTGSTQKDSLTGPPTKNPYYGQISEDNVFTSPFFQSFSGSTFTSASFPWGVFDLDQGQAWTWLEVEPLTVLHEQPEAAASAYFETGAVRMRGGFFGCAALRNPRFVYLNSPIT